MSFLIADFASVMTKIGYILVAILALMVMIIIHELGHYTAGKLLGFKINEFAIGFGPAIFKKTMKSGEIFSIRPVPLGGFCAFEGEDKDSDAAVEGAFNNQKPWKRIIVLLAGVTFNFLSAILILTIAFSTYGYTLPQVKSVNTSIENYEQNFQAGDVILKLDGKNVYSLNEFNLKTLLSKVDGNETTALVARNGEKVTIKVNIGTFKAEDGTEYRGIGITSSATNYRLNVFEAFVRAVVFIFQLIVLMFQTVGKLFTGAVGVAGNLGGPITTVAIMSDTISVTGFRGVLLMFGIISASIAIMNALPLPALDGSRVVFTIVEWIRGKPIKRKTEAIIHTVGLIVLFGLTIVCDIINLTGILNLG